jgi:hypothetical protein
MSDMSPFAMRRYRKKQEMLEKRSRIIKKIVALNRDVKYAKEEKAFFLGRIWHNCKLKMMDRVSRS